MHNTFVMAFNDFGLGPTWHWCNPDKLCTTGFLCGRLVGSLPEYLRDPAVGRDSFRKQLKTFLFATY